MCVYCKKYLERQRGKTFGDKLVEDFEVATVRSYSIPFTVNRPIKVIMPPYVPQLIMDAQQSKSRINRKIKQYEGE
jgi:hypothetical protein